LHGFYCLQADKLVNS